MIKPIAEARESITSLALTLSVIHLLVSSDNLKYLTRADREKHLQDLLNQMGSLEDTLKAIVKQVRAVRRARIRDDDVISRMALELAELGTSIDSLVSAPAAVDEEPAETLTVTVNVEDKPVTE